MATPTPPNPFIWPFPKKDQSQWLTTRIDNGWDLEWYDPTNPDVYAVASGKVHYAHDKGGFGDPYCWVELDTPLAQGVGIYYGHVVPTKTEGTHVSQGDGIATTKYGPQGDAKINGWLEIGFWGPSQSFFGSGATGDGQAMHDMLINAPTASDAGIANPGGGTSGPPGTTPPTTSTGTNGGDNSSGTGPPGKPGVPNNLMIADLKDVRDNRPFHVFFSSALKLIRGGMFELQADMSGFYGTQAGTGIKAAPRKGGQFACFFMMNPNSISVNCTIDNSLTSPLNIAPDTMAAFPSWVQNQSITFTIIFNRQYDVWQGLKGSNPKYPALPGPADIGVRWDIRALERLMGVYDATNESALGVAAGVGEGASGPGSRPPSGLPVQVVFGGPNSYQFQGVIGQFDYTYTLFDVNMIPVEASVDITVMRQYMPMLSNADVVTKWAGVTGQYQGVGDKAPVHSVYGPGLAPVSFNAGTAISRVFGQ